MTNHIQRGYWLAAASILLATFAQLAMKWGMSHLPIITPGILSLDLLLTAKLPIFLVCAGIIAYLLSTLSWLGALGQMPLNKAYPLLSISYALVYIATVTLPWFQESFSLIRCLGVVLISLGVLLVVSSPSQK